MKKKSKKRMRKKKCEKKIFLNFFLRKNFGEFFFLSEIFLDVFCVVVDGGELC